MDQAQGLDAMMTEHRFWLKITDDHARFVFHALSPSETGEIERARSFIVVLDSLQGPAGRSSGRQNVAELTEKTKKIVRDFYAFLLQILALTVSSQINSRLSSESVNHMINETAEYLELMERFGGGQSVDFTPIHFHMLWLFGSAEHAGAVAAGLDPMERDRARECARFSERFSELYMKSVCLRGCMRTKLETFPALALLGGQSASAARAFRSFLEEMRDSRKSGGLQGSLSPELADHMAREEGYYLLKLSAAPETAGGTAEA